MSVADLASLFNLDVDTTKKLAQKGYTSPGPVAAPESGPLVAPQTAFVPGQDPFSKAAAAEAGTSVEQTPFNGFDMSQPIKVLGVERPVNGSDTPSPFNQTVQATPQAAIAKKAIAANADAASRKVANAPASDHQGYVVPGGFQPTTRATQGLSLDPESMQMARDYNTAETTNRGIQASQQLEADKMRASGELMAARRRAIADDEYQDQLEQNRIQKDAFVQAQMSHLDKLSQNVANARDQFWKDSGGVFGRIAAAIAIGMGAFGSRGGPNHAYEIIKNSVDDYVNTQAKLFDDGKARFTELYKQFPDRERYLLAVKNAAYENVSGMLAQQKAKADSKQADANYSKMLADNASEQGKAAKEFAALTGVRWQSGEAYRPAQFVGNNGPSIDPEENTVSFAAGNDGEVSVKLPSKESFNEFSKQAVASAQAQKAVATIKDLRAQYWKEMQKPFYERDPTLLQSTEKKIVANNVLRIQAQSAANGQGIVRPEEMKQQLDMFDPMSGLDWTNINVTKHLPGVADNYVAGNNWLDAQIKLSQDQLANGARALGGHMVKRTMVQDQKTGRVYPGTVYTGQAPVSPNDDLYPRGSVSSNPSATPAILPNYPVKQLPTIRK